MGGRGSLKLGSAWPARDGEGGSWGGADIHGMTGGAVVDIHCLGAMGRTRIVWGFALRGAS